MTSRVLTYLQQPQLADVRGGQMLRQVLLKIVEPSIFWEAFSEAYRIGALSDQAQSSFAWLTLKLVSLPGDDATTYREEANDPSIIKSLLESSQADVSQTHSSHKRSTYRWK